MAESELQKAIRAARAQSQDSEAHTVAFHQVMFQLGNLNLRAYTALLNGERQHTIAGEVLNALFRTVVNQCDVGGGVADLEDGKNRIVRAAHEIKSEYVTPRPGRSTTTSTSSSAPRPRSRRRAPHSRAPRTAPSPDMRNLDLAGQDDDDDQANSPACRQRLDGEGSGAMGRSS